jgi:pyruvate dehydrogenase E2 component (dihydrolipoamide acetyltransferase)
MEALSPTMEEGKVINWLKSEGDTVANGDVLAEVETDKAVMELQARGKGVLKKILVGEGETTEVGNLVAVIAGEDEDISDLLKETEGDGKKAAEAAAAAEKKKPAAPAAPPAPAAGEAGDGGRIKASPLARRMAREQGLDLARIEGSGPGGRIIKRDIDAAPAAVAAPAAPAAYPSEGYEDVELSQIRKTIAKRLVQSLGPIPHFFLTTEIDMERAAEMRGELNGIDDDSRISFNDIIVKVVAMALRQHRECNAWWQDSAIRYWNEVHIAMAVAIDEGLITPVIRHTDQKSLRQIAQESRALVERARSRKLKPDEYTGGTFSVSNLGMFGIDEFTAVINPPEAGIIAVGALAEKPVAVDGRLVVRKRMRVTMSCDHRVIDGATGARFLATFQRMMENPLAIVW